ncbi:acyl carrier protein [Luteibacter yeojuensis]|uniref:Acyl carrier protein n=1 Tax=Luteibacter yeojuensis TaxID=345309 RepID=A0A7X5TRV4_9GAMM|nr:acyl carrier protein [Luteibacter yeojuensis]
MDEPIRDRIVAVIARQVNLEPAALHPEATLKSLGIASLDAIELIFDLEEHFDITFPEDSADFNTDTVQHLIDAVEQALANRPGETGAAA